MFNSKVLVSLNQALSASILLSLWSTLTHSCSLWLTLTQGLSPEKKTALLLGFAKFPPPPHPPYLDNFIGSQGPCSAQGSPFLKCVVPIWALHERGGGVKACQDALEHFFPTFARLTEGWGSKAIWVLPI